LSDTEQSPLVHAVRIRPADTDYQGIVHSSKYAQFFESAFLEVARAVDGSLDFLTSTGVFLVMAETTIRYLSSARFDDLLEVAVWLRHIGTTSVIMSYESRVDGRHVVLGTARYVAFTQSDFVKAPVPDKLREVLERIPAEPAELAQKWASR
jgi:acyl-CoA thioester hydrolase